MRTSLAFLLLPLSLSSLACSMLHPGSAGDAGANDGASATDAAASASSTGADNANDVARFPDEVSLANASAKITEGRATAHNSVPNGTVIATLGLGTEVTQIASHEGFILGTFSDPKNASRTIEGWIPQAAFSGGGGAPKGGCPAGQNLLVGADAKDFCGRICKADKDCPTGETCSGKANVITGGKPGAEMTTCTIPGGPTPTPSGSPSSTPSSTPSAAPSSTSTIPTSPTSTIQGVQQPPGPGGVCPAKYVIASDHMCHFDCTKSPMQCPPHSRCTAKLTNPKQPVCEPNP